VELKHYIGSNDSIKFVNKPEVVGIGHKLFLFSYIVTIILISIAHFILYTATGDPFFSLDVPDLIISLLFLTLFYILARWIIDLSITGYKLEKYMENNQNEKAGKLIDNRVHSKYHKIFGFQERGFLNMKALYYYKIGEKNSGLKLVKKILKKYPTFMEAWFLKGVIEANTNQKENAVKSLTKAFKLFKKNTRKNTKDKFKNWIRSDEDLQSFVDSKEYNVLLGELR